MTAGRQSALSAPGIAGAPTLARIARAWRAIPVAHFAIAFALGTGWGLANALGWWLGGDSAVTPMTAAHFVYEGLWPMLLLVLAIGIADAWTGDDTDRSLPYVAAAVGAALVGEFLFFVTTPLVGLDACHCRMDRWPDGARIANMLPDSLIICGFVTAGYLYRRRAAQRGARLHGAQVERVRLLRKTQESRLQAMQACIEPEFLFDTLAEVQRLHATEPKTALRLLDELIVYLRAALPHLRESTSVVARECELARAYLDIHRMRGGGQLQFTLDADADAADASMPPMVLLPLVDHALVSMRAAGVNGAMRDALHLTASRDGPRLRIRLQAGDGVFGDSGVGAEALAGVRERLRKLYGDAASLVLSADDQRTTSLTLEIPYEPTHGHPR